VEVVVDVTIDSLEALEGTEVLIGQAHAQAGDWVAEHGITGKQLAYRIEDGQLTSIPIVS
jgi:hypothetical protein